MSKANKVKFIIYIALFFLIEAVAHAYEVDKVKSGDTAVSIAKRNINRVWMKYGNNYSDYAKDIKKWNPEISDWEHPPKNQLIYVDYPYAPHAAGSTWAPALGLEEEEGDEFTQRFSLGVFYASSFGSYTEQVNEQSITSGQNFPVTIGVGGSYATTDEKKDFVVGSLYWAQSSKGNVTGNAGTPNSEMSIPGEVGFNIYYQRYLKDRLLGIYSGYDFEKLNTFNTDQVVNGLPIANVDNKIHYATIGVTKGFTFFDLNTNLKASFSKTIASSTSGTKSLSGYKYILFYTYKPEGRFNFNVFFKHHSLTGPTELSINRIGFTVGISIF